MLLVKELSKKIDHKQILDNITLNIPKGSIYGIIGENGAGKTTLIQCIVGIYKSDQGEVFIDGKSVWENDEAKQMIGYVADRNQFFKGYKVKELVDFFEAMHPNFSRKDFERYNAIFKIKVNQKVTQLSKGMKKQVMFILALAIMPEYLIMDEPFDGLDPHIRKVIWDILIQDVSERNMTIFISSHHLNELDSMCDHIALINNGKIVFEEALDHLKEGYHKLQIVLECGDDMYALEKELKVLSHQMMGRVHTLIVAGEIEAINRTVEKYCPLINETLSLSLEEIFLFTLGGEYDELKEVMG